MLNARITNAACTLNDRLATTEPSNSGGILTATRSVSRVTYDEVNMCLNAYKRITVKQTHCFQTGFYI